MNYLIHGDYHLQSRNFLTELVSQAKTQNKEVIRLEGDKLTLNELIQAAASNSLFLSERTIVIENLFSRLKSKEQDSLLDWLKSYQGEHELILWEKKNIGKILQRKLPPKTQVKEFKTPVLVFKLVELLSPATVKQALETFEQAVITEPAEFLFAMFARQIRLLILIKEGHNIGGAPWMIGKMKKQASGFSQAKLVILYHKLYEIDSNIKRGETIMPLSWHLSFWISELEN